MGVFKSDPRDKRPYRAYLRWYNPQWEGCREFMVRATNGPQAKRKAIQMSREIDEAGAEAERNIKKRLKGVRNGQKENENGSY